MSPCAAELALASLASPKTSGDNLRVYPLSCLAISVISYRYQAWEWLDRKENRGNVTRQPGSSAIARNAIGLAPSCPSPRPPRLRQLSVRPSPARTAPQKSDPASRLPRAKTRCRESNQLGQSRVPNRAVNPTRNKNRPLAQNRRRSPVTPPGKLAIDAEETDPLAPDDLGEMAVRSAPAWLVSLVFHTLLIIVLALLYVAKEIPPEPSH